MCGENLLTCCLSVLFMCFVRFVVLCVGGGEWGHCYCLRIRHDYVHTTIHCSSSATHSPFLAAIHCSCATAGLLFAQPFGITIAQTQDVFVVLKEDAMLVQT